MKKLVYILVAVFTMVSVNAFGQYGRYIYLFYDHPADDSYLYVSRRDYPYKNIQHEKIWCFFEINGRKCTGIKFYTDETMSKEVKPTLPTCIGYRFVGYYTDSQRYEFEISSGSGAALKWNTELNEMYVADIKYIFDIYHPYYNEDDIFLYTKWEYDTKNYIWNESHNGFYEKNEKGKAIYNTFRHHKYLNHDLTGTNLYLHYIYPGGSEDDSNQIIYYIDKSSFSYININYGIINNAYKDETKKEVVDFKLPTCKGYKPVFRLKNEKENTIYVNDNDKIVINGCLYLNEPDCHLYVEWEKDTKNFIWEDDGSGFYGTNKYGDIDWDSFTPWNHMFTTTDINEIEVSNEVKSNKAEGIYTLNGVKVNEITKSGIYIVNGKKVVK